MLKFAFIFKLAVWYFKNKIFKIEIFVEMEELTLILI